MPNWIKKLSKKHWYLYHILQETYEYLISDTAIQETIECNDYLFTPDGTHAYWLLKFETV